MNKDEMFEEIAKALCGMECKYCEDCFHLRQANKIYNAGYRKVGDDEIVIQKDVFEEVSKDYATINNEAYYCGFSAGVEEAKQETRDILRDLYMYFTEDYLWGFKNSNKDHKSASLVKRLCKAYGIELGG